MKKEKSGSLHNRIWLPLILATAVLGFGRAAPAADATTAPASSAADDKQSATVRGTQATESGLEEIVVTAQRREASLSKVAVAVTALGANQLTERSITTETDLQAAVPGLTVKTGENANSIFYAIRGQTLDVASGSSPAVLPYVNDVQISSATAAQFYDLQSVQVLKGPQGTLFGRNTTGGAVLYTTAQPTDEFGGFVTVRGGSYDLYQEQGAVNLPLIEHVADLRVAFDFKHEDGYVRNIFDGSNLGNIDDKSGRISLLLTPVDGLKSTFVVQFGTSNGTELNGEAYSIYPVGATNNGYALNSTAAGIYAPGSPQFTPAVAAKFPAGIVAYLTQQRAQGPYVEDLDFTPLHQARATSASNTTTYDLTPDLQLKNILGYSHSWTRSDANLSGTPFGILDINSPSYGGEHYFIDAWSEEAQLLGKAFDQNLKYIVGVYAAENRTRIDFPVEVGADLTSPIAEFHYDTTNNDDTYALFAQATYDLSRLTGISGLSVTAGARTTEEQISLRQNFDSVFVGSPEQRSDESHPSWQLGVQEQLTPNLLLYAVNRGSWRSGNFNGNAPPANGENFFGPETTVDYEIGAKFSGILFGRDMHANLALYNQNIKNVQRDVYLEIDGAPASFTQNVPKANVKGVELDADVRAANWLTVGMAGAYTQGKYTDPTVSAFGESLTFSTFPDTPDWSGSVYGQIDFPVAPQTGAVSVRADVYAQTSTWFTSLGYSISPGTELPHYSIVNMRGDWHNIFETRLSLGLYVRNLQNKAYFQGGFANGPSSGVNVASPAPPRMYGAELNYAF
jgi:iron complex outermembrane recepter protein